MPPSRSARVSLRRVGFAVVIAEHREHRHLDAGHQLPREALCLLGCPVVGEIAEQQQDVGTRIFDRLQHRLQHVT